MPDFVLLELGEFTSDWWILFKQEAAMRKLFHVVTTSSFTPGVPLLTWINFNPNMDD